MTLKQPQLVLTAALALLALAIAGGGLLAVVLPQRNQAGSLDQSLASAEAELAMAQTRAPSPLAAGSNAVDVFRLMEAMPDEVEMPLVMLDLSALAQESRVSLQSVKPSAPVALAAGYTAVPISVDITGTYATVTAFLRDVREAVQDPPKGLSVSGRLLVTNEVQLMSPDGRTVDATLNLDAFQYGAPPSATAGAPSGAALTTTTASSS